MAFGVFLSLALIVTILRLRQKWQLHKKMCVCVCARARAVMNAQTKSQCAWECECEWKNIPNYNMYNVHTLVLLYSLYNERTSTFSGTFQLRFHLPLSSSHFALLVIVRDSPFFLSIIRTLFFKLGKIMWTHDLCNGFISTTTAIKNHIKRIWNALHSSDDFAHIYFVCGWES